VDLLGLNNALYVIHGYSVSWIPPVLIVTEADLLRRLTLGFNSWTSTHLNKTSREKINYEEYGQFSVTSRLRIAEQNGTTSTSNQRRAIKHKSPFKRGKGKGQIPHTLNVAEVFGLKVFKSSPTPVLIQEVGILILIWILFATQIWNANPEKILLIYLTNQRATIRILFSKR